MKNILACLALLMSIAPASAHNRLPRDVQRFIERREGCDHMRGEMPDSNEKKRMEALNFEIEKLCKGTDRELARLKNKYVLNASVMKRLNEFEKDIEVREVPIPDNKR